MFQLLLFISVCLKSVYCYNFDTDNVQVFSDSSLKDTYFAYSVLLQKGNPSIAIVGAPKKKSWNEGGSVYRCDLDASHCTKYNIAADTQNSFNGNFFGLVLDGDDFTGGDFFTCAPRVVHNERNENYLTYGLCFQQKNSSSFTERAEVLTPLNNQAISRDDSTGQYYYNNGFGEAGMSMAFIKERSELFLGAPGIRGWTGATISYDLQDGSKTVLPFKSNYLNSYEYLGYMVTTGKFEQSRTKISYLAGAPRSYGLKGSVKIFEFDANSSDRTKTLATLQGNDLGSYFGSSICAVDLNGDEIDDILVGAPMGAGKTWDEGYVEVFKVGNGRKIEAAGKLTGSSQSGGKFGMSIAFLGDIDLDGFNDVAISAPYEDDGAGRTGAVYIYRGSSNGVQNKYSQKLVPSGFKVGQDILNSIQGFGLGLSKGNDIDLNGHNDLAIGAYKTDQLFVLRTLSVIDFKLKLIPNVTIIGTDSIYINIRCCLTYNQRSKTRDLISLEFKMDLDLDYRTNGQSNISEILNVKLDDETCRDYNIQLKPTVKDISPFMIKIKGAVIQTKLIAQGDKLVEKWIPFSHGCGDDNICDTDLSVKGSTKMTEITIGLNSLLDILVEIENFGEPAYQCELYLQIPENIDIKNPKNCNKKDNFHVCPVNERLLNFKKVDITLYLKNIDPSMDEFEISLEVKSLGQNIGNTIKDVLTIPVQLENSPFITSKSDPESLDLVSGTDADADLNKDIEIYHTFSVGNYGPSPVKLDVNFLLPLIKNKNGDFLTSIKIQASINDVDTDCGLVNETYSNLDLSDETFEHLINAPLNRTIILSCGHEHVECINYFCKGDYFYKSSELAVYEVKMKAKINLLESNYAKQLETKNLIAFISTAFLQNSTDIIQGHASTLLFHSGRENKVAIWIYIVSSVAGTILLVLLVLLLYKCHFFDRNYKDRLNQEKLLDPKDGIKNNLGSPSESVEEFNFQNVAQSDPTDP